MGRGSACAFTLVLSLLLTGCIAYRTGKLQEISPDTLANVGKLTGKPSCAVSHRLNIQSIPTCVSISPDRLAFDQQEYVLRYLKEANVFSSCLPYAKGDECSDIRLSSACTFTWSEFESEIPIGAFTLFLFPARMHEYRFSFTFAARRRDGLFRQYEFAETVVDRLGVFVLFVAPFLSEGSYAKSFESVNRLAVGNLLVQMQKDGFFDPPPKQAVSAPSGSNAVSSDRLKELESLKAAGVISEEEYRREVERLKNVGKGMVK